MSTAVLSSLPIKRPRRAQDKRYSPSKWITYRTLREHMLRPGFGAAAVVGVQPDGVTWIATRVTQGASAGYWEMRAAPHTRCSWSGSLSLGHAVLEMRRYGAVKFGYVPAHLIVELPPGAEGGD